MKYSKFTESGEIFTVDSEKDSLFSIFLYTFTDYAAAQKKRKKKVSIFGFFKDIWQAIPIRIRLFGILAIPIFIMWIILKTAFNYEKK